MIINDWESLILCSPISIYTIQVNKIKISKEQGREVTTLVIFGTILIQEYFGKIY